MPSTHQQDQSPRGGARPLITLVLGPLAFAAVLALPLPGGLPAAGRAVAASAVWMAIWWIGEAVPMAITALLPLVLFPALGALGVKQVAPCYANHVVFLFLGGFLLAAAVQRSGLHRRIAFAVLALVGTTPTRVVLGFMIATALLSMWISNTATTLMMLPIAVAAVRALAEQARAEPAERQRVEQRFGLVLMLGIAYAASIGGVGTLIGTPPNVLLAGQLTTLFPDLPPIGFAEWMVVGVPVVVIFVPLAWLYLVRFGGPVPLTRLDLGALDRGFVRARRAELGPPSRGEISVAVVFALTALLWIFRADIDLGGAALPGWSGLFPEPGFLGDSTVAIAAAVALFVIPVDLRGREFLLRWQDARAVPWGVLILFGGGFALAEGIGASGLAAWIGDRLTLLAGVPTPLLVVGVCVLVTLLTELTSNTATVAMLLPVLAGLARQLEIAPLLLMVPATLSASFAFTLPVATPPNAIVMGSGWVTIPRMVRAGLALDAIGVALITGLVLLLERFLGSG